MLEYTISWRAWRGYGSSEKPHLAGTSTVRVHTDADGRVARATAMNELREFLAREYRGFGTAASSVLSIEEVEHVVA